MAHRESMTSRWLLPGLMALGAALLLQGCETSGSGGSSDRRADRGGSSRTRTQDRGPDWLDQEAATYKNLFDAAQWDALPRSRDRLVEAGEPGVKFLVQLLLVRIIGTPSGELGAGAAGQAHVDRVATFRRKAEEELIAIGSPGIPFLAEYARTGRPEVGRHAARVLSYLGPEGMDALVDAARRAPDNTRRVLVEALGATGDPGALPHLERFLEGDVSWQVRGMAARAMGPLGRTIGSDRVLPGLARAAQQDRDIFVVQMVARSLVELDVREGLPAAVTCLERFLEDDPPQFGNARVLSGWMDRINRSRHSIDVEAWRRDVGR